MAKLSVTFGKVNSICLLYGTIDEVIRLIAGDFFSMYLIFSRLKSFYEAILDFSIVGSPIGQLLFEFTKLSIVNVEFGKNSLTESIELYTTFGAVITVDNSPHFTSIVSLSDTKTYPPVALVTI